MTRLLVGSCGPRTSLQDAGRFGYQRYGVSNSGAMDRLALAAANHLVGNEPGTAAIELMLLGGSFRLEGGGSAAVAVAGAPCPVSLDGEPAGHGATLIMRSGQTLTLGPMQAGVFAYLAVAGSFDVPAQLGSVSLHQRAALGGLNGRNLTGGDPLPLCRSEAREGRLLRLRPLPLEATAPIRIILGPQDDHFTAEGIATFLSSAYRITREADRMGYRLAGPPIAHSLGYNIVSDGIVSGSIQVPGAGEPIVMMADRQTTGGYPKIATVISADLRVVAQRRPGDFMRFVRIGMEEAQGLARERARLIETLEGSMAHAEGGLPAPEDLLALNLAGSAVDALAPDPDPL